MSSDTQTGGFNPWPYSIIAFFTVAIAAAVAWVVFCIGHSSDLVAADYYEQEIEYQAQLDRVQRVQKLSGAAGIFYTAETGTIRIQLPPEHAAAQVNGSVHLYRPSQASLDQELPLETTAAGVQLVSAHQLTPGLWDVRVEWTALGEDYYLSEKLKIGGE